MITVARRWWFLGFAVVEWVCAVVAAIEGNWWVFAILVGTSTAPLRAFLNLQKATGRPLPFARRAHGD